jgi:hypothetical protein
VLFTGIFTSGCGRVDRAISGIEKLEADLDRGISTIANDNTRWRSTLQELASAIPDDVQSTVRIELQQLANRSIATAGTEIRCNVDFLAHRAIEGLRRVKALLRNQDPEPLPPEICQVSPATLDMNIERPRRVDVSISGYDMDHVDSGGKPLHFVYVSDPQNRTFPFLEERIGRTHHYLITLNTSGTDFDQFIYHNQINKIRAEWGDRSEPPEIIVTRWEPRRLERTVPLGSFDHTPPHTHGDRDFDTSDDEETDVNLAVETQQEGSSILVRVYMKARERDPDNTTVEGWSQWKVAYPAPAGWQIRSVNRLGRSDASFTATSHQLRTSTLPQGEIADRFETWVDRSGDEAGSFTRTQVFLRPVDVVLEEIPPF